MWVLIVYTLPHPLSNNLLCTFVNRATCMHGHAVICYLSIGVNICEKYCHSRLRVHMNMGILKMCMSPLLCCGTV